MPQPQNEQYNKHQSDECYDYRSNDGPDLGVIGLCITWSDGSCGMVVGASMKSVEMHVARLFDNEESGEVLLLLEQFESRKRC